MADLWSQGRGFDSSLLLAIFLREVRTCRSKEVWWRRTNWEICLLVKKWTLAALHVPGAKIGLIRPQHERKKYLVSQCAQMWRFNAIWAFFAEPVWFFLVIYLLLGAFGAKLLLTGGNFFLAAYLLLGTLLLTIGLLITLIIWPHCWWQTWFWN